MRIWLTSTLELNIGSAGLFLAVHLDRGTLEFLGLLTGFGIMHDLCFFSFWLLWRSAEREEGLGLTGLRSARIRSRPHHSLALPSVGMQ